QSDPDMLFARRLLLVEGPVDKYGLPRLAAVLGKSLAHVTIISCNGKGKIPYYALLARAYGLDWYTVFDLDNKPTTDHENRAVLESTPEDRLIWFDTSFESLLG